MKIKKSTIVIFSVLLAINLLFSAGTAAFLVCRGTGAKSEIAGQDTEPAEKYTLYIGLNDKDTNTQLISTRQAKSIVNKICAEYAGNYTAVDACGGWVDESGRQITENSLVYSFCGISEEKIKTVLDELLKALNQSSILVEHETVTSVYYSGEMKGR